MICPLADAILKRGCAKRKASIFIKLADKMQSSAKCWQVRSADALTVIRFCMSLRCCTRRKRKIRTLLQSETGSDFSCLVGAGGFEPPKLKAADLQSVPIGHSGTRPYSLFVSFAGRLVYSIMQKGFCQLFFYLFLQMRFPCRETARKALQLCRHGKVGEKSQPEEIDRQIARKTRDNM